MLARVRYAARINASSRGVQAILGALRHRTGDVIIHPAPIDRALLIDGTHRT